MRCIAENIYLRPSGLFEIPTSRAYHRLNSQQPLAHFRSIHDPPAPLHLQELPMAGPVRPTISHARELSPRDYLSFAQRVFD